MEWFDENVGFPLRVVVRLTRDGNFEVLATSDIEVLTVDEGVRYDRVYRISSDATNADIDLLIGDSVIRNTCGRTVPLVAPAKTEVSGANMDEVLKAKVTTFSSKSGGKKLGELYYRALGVEERAAVDGVVQDIVFEHLRINPYPLLDDDTYDDGESARAAAAYAASSAGLLAEARKLYPWGDLPMSDKRDALVRAGALIVEEIERLDRQAAS